MAAIKSTDLVRFVMDAKTDGWGYVYSARGQLYTRELAQQWGKANRSGKGFDYYVNQCAHWIGKIVVDCSGLIIAAFRSQIPAYGNMTANTLYERSVQKGLINVIPDVPGLCVWRRGHIGVYLGNNQVIEAGGTSKGVVLSALDAPATGKAWTHWGKMFDVDYSAAGDPPIMAPPVSFWLGRKLELTEPPMHGDDVARVQTALASKGFSPGFIDGVYGPDTKDAVLRFQEHGGLVTSGAVDVNTTYSLLGVWDEGCDQDNPARMDAFLLDRVLKRSRKPMQGSDVRDVQDALGDLGFLPESPDGVYDKKTKKAVISFQQANHLKADGKVGPETANALGGVWIQATQ